MSLKSVTVGAAREASTTGHERRRSSRKSQSIEAFVRSPQSPARTEVQNVNLSRHGVGFAVATALTIGDNYIIEIGFGDQRLVSEIHVIACRQLDGGSFDIGAEFC